MALGIVVVGFHSNADLTDFTWALLRADPQIPFYINFQIVEVQKDELEIAEALTIMLEEKAEFAGITTHIDNCGYARACNDGAHWLDLVSDGTVDTYAFFNADTLVTPGLLEHCYATLNSDDSYAVLGPRQTDKNGRLTHAGIFGTEAHPKHRGWYEPALDGRYGDIVECLTVSGAAYFIKRHIWDELRDCSLYQTADPDSYGAFLQTSHFYEETWCSVHARAHGYKVIYNGEASMIHKWQGATPKGPWAQQMFIQSRDLFRSACDIHSIDHD